MSCCEVFLVEDDSDDRYFFEQALNKINPSIAFCYAKNGMEALKKLAGNSIPSVIFTDLNMPVLNGLDFVRMLKQNVNLMNIPVIAISTSTLPQHSSLMLNAGAELYITKQDDYILFENEIASVLKRFCVI